MDDSILLMYISENSGHHSATLAIERAIHSLNPAINVLNINGFRHVSPFIERIVNTLYMSAINRLPQVWDFLYDNPSVERRIKSLKEGVNKKNHEKIRGLIEGHHCKVVICSQAFPCGMVAEYKKQYAPDLMLIAVVTDFVPHSYWIYDEVNYYVVASECAKEILMKKGIKEGKIKILGIPIDPKFNNKLEKIAVAKELGIQNDKPVILVMGGSRGFGPIKDIIRTIDNSNVDAYFLVVAGANQRLFKWLQKRNNRKHILAFPSIDYIDKLMSVSEVIVSKPGGITTAEALTKQLPMIIVKPIPGQEDNNTNYLLRAGVALKVDKIEDLGGVLASLLSDRQRRSIIREKMS